MANLIRNFVYGKKGGLDDSPKISGSDFKPDNSNPNIEYTTLSRMIYVDEYSSKTYWIVSYTYNFERNKSIKSFKTNTSTLTEVFREYSPPYIFVDINLDDKNFIEFVKNDGTRFIKNFIPNQKVSIEFENGLNDLKEIRMMQGPLSMYIINAQILPEDSENYTYCFANVVYGFNNPDIEYEITYY